MSAFKGIRLCVIQKCLVNTSLVMMLTCLFIGFSPFNQLSSYGIKDIIRHHEGFNFSMLVSFLEFLLQIKSKKDAEITERQLLDKFDYAWNKGSNVSRRQDDILKKLARLEKASKFSLLAKKFLFSNQREVGIKIRNGSIVSGKSNSTIFSRILGVRRLQARPVQSGYGHCGDNICGVATGHGSVCMSPPVAGRKRCAVHKGLRVNGYISEVDAEGKVSHIAANLKSGVETDHEFSDFQDQKQSYITENHHPCEKATGKKFILTCGIILEDGSPCKRNPIQGNKRCLEHKGRRIRVSNLSSQAKNYENIAFD